MGSVSNFADKALGGVFDSDVGKVDPVMGLWSGYGSGIKDMFGDITGSNAADAANDAAKLQYQATMEGIKAQQASEAQQRADLAPFRGLATNSGLNAFRKTALNQENYSYNPNNDALLNNALNRTTRAVMDAQAAKGKLGSGSTLTSLTEAMAPVYMNREQQVFENRYNANNQQFNQLQNMLGMAQNAAAGQGAATANATNNITDLTTQGANAQAAGAMGAANAQAQGTQNMAGLAALAASLFMGSDERLKEDVKRVGKMNDGTPIYTYKYKQGDGKTHMGVMAQEARKKHPDAVRKDPLTNMLMVNYGAL